MAVTRRPIEQPRFVLQRGPDSPVEPCACGCPFGVLRFALGVASLTCPDCGAALDASMVQLHEIDPALRRSPGHPPCPSWSRVIVPKVRDEVGREWAAKNGAERWDMFCVECGEKDGSVKKDELRGYRTSKKRDDDNAAQRVEVLERAGHRCDLCCDHGVPLDVGHCLSKKDAESMGVAREVRESVWNKCALCRPCNLAHLGGYGERSMSPSTYCNLAHTRAEARQMLDIGREAVQPEFYRVYSLLRQRLAERRKETA